ncbi:NUDIX domain-containing protein [Candidatus Pacearchaeota archaeon]|nr:NUDIX domain-containing protein [Candidatus Pacearchaeota archaeon]
MKNKIMSLFAFEFKLRFNEIKDKLKIRSNNLAYWLKKLVKQGIIVKDSNGYSLTETAEYHIPYFSSTRSALPIVLIKIGNKNQAFLYRRAKRPYKNLLALPGGRIFIGESPEEAAKRIMKSKFSIDILNPEFKNIFIEHIKSRDDIINSFILIIIKAFTLNSINLTNIKSNKKHIIKSDYEIINLKENKIKLKTINSKYL